MTTETDPKGGGALPPTVAELKSEIEVLKTKLSGAVSKDEAAELRRQIEVLRAELAEVKKMEKDDDETKRREEPEDRPERPGGRLSDHFLY